jgi:hypothetical protein
MTAQPIETPEVNADAIAATATEAITTAKLEGSVEMPQGLKKLYMRKLLLDKRKEEIEFEIESIKDTFEERLRELGVKSFTILGKNKATVSEYPKSYAKPARIAEKYPLVAADPECFSTQDQVTVTIRK